jgi:hypothetical protein
MVCIYNRSEVVVLTPVKFSRVSAQCLTRLSFLPEYFFFGWLWYVYRYEVVVLTPVKFCSVSAQHLTRLSFLPQYFLVIKP